MSRQIDADIDEPEKEIALDKNRTYVSEALGQINTIEGQNNSVESASTITTLELSVQQDSSIINGNVSKLSDPFSSAKHMQVLENFNSDKAASNDLSVNIMLKQLFQSSFHVSNNLILFPGIVYYRRVIGHPCHNYTSINAFKSYQDQIGAFYFPLLKTPSKMIHLSFMSANLTSVSDLPLLTCFLGNQSGLGVVWGSGTSLLNCMGCYDMSLAYHRCPHPVSLLRGGVS